MKSIRTAALVVLSCLGSACGVGPEEPQGADELGTAHDALTRGWTQADVDAIARELRTEQPSSYRVVVPTFTRGIATGQTTLGTLSMSNVSLTATRLNVQLRPGANVVTAKMCGSGSGSHTESATPGTDIARRLDAILVNIDASTYQHLR
jgi:hypothetical protein